MIESNLDAVIDRTRRLPGRIAEAVKRAALPLSWQDEARDVATQILIRLARPDQMGSLGPFVRTVVAAVLPGGEPGFVLSMRRPDDRLRNALADARVTYGLATPNERAQGLFAAGLNQFEKLILEWVATPEEEGGKRRDARDWGKTDEEIAQLITYIMLSPHLGEGGLAARLALTPHLAAFMQRKSEQIAPNVTAQEADEWLRAVLLGWRSWVRQRYPERIREELLRVP